MTVDDFERETLRAANRWALVRSAVTVDKTDYAIKMHLHIAPSCFVQIYANSAKNLISYALVLNRQRIFGRDCDSGQWHRHPYGSPSAHDFSPEGTRSITLAELLLEAQQILQAEGIV